jgi:replication factor C subunit 2/4
MKTFVETYQPNTLKQIIGNENIITKLNLMVQSKKLQNLIITGFSGCGKSSSIFAVIKELDAEYIELNASDERNISTIRSTIKTFATKKSFRPKIIVLEEIDNMPTGSQHGIVSLMQNTNTCFILTCNDYDKIIENLSSRCMVLKFSPINNNDIIKRLKKICKDNNILYDEDVLNLIAIRSDGDLRKAINILQSCYFYLNNTNKLSEDILYKCSSEPSGKMIQNIINFCINKNIDNAFTEMEKILLDGYDCSDIISYLFKECMYLNFEKKLLFLKAIGDTHINIINGGSKIQIFTLLILLSRL